MIFLLLIVTNRVRANLIRVAEGLLHTQRRANIMSRGLFSFRNSFLSAIVLFVVWLWLYVAKFVYVLMQSTLIASDVSCLFVCVSQLWQISFFFKFSFFSSRASLTEVRNRKEAKRINHDIIKKVIIVWHKNLTLHSFLSHFSSREALIYQHSLTIVTMIIEIACLPLYLCNFVPLRYTFFPVSLKKMVRTTKISEGGTLTNWVKRLSDKQKF